MLATPGVVPGSGRYHPHRAMVASHEPPTIEQAFASDTVKPDVGQIRQAIAVHTELGNTAEALRIAAGVGLAVGRAVRTSIVAINVIDLFLSMAIWGTTTTVRLAG